MKLARPLLATLSFFAALVSAQSDEGTDIYLTELSLKQGVLTTGKLTNITARKGYDNQPHFLPDGEGLLYTSQRNHEGQPQMEGIYYDLVNGNSRNLTNSAVSEYSPTLMPDGEHFSVIRANDEGKQKLWAYPLQDGNPKELLNDVEPVGYHAWVDAHNVVLFIVGEPHELQLANIQSQQVKVLDLDIGASLYQIPGSKDMSYTRRKTTGDNNTPWQLVRLNVEQNSKTVLTELPEGAYYYAWTSDGKAIAAQGTEILYWDSKVHSADDPWQPFADVASQCPKGVSRLAVSPQQTTLALVCDR